MSGRYVSVALIDPSVSHLPRTFAYSLPDDFDAPVGALVRVPFRGRRRTGVVVATGEEPSVDAVLPVSESPGVALGAELVSLCEWIASRYLATLGEALAAAVPRRVVSEEREAPRKADHPRRRPALGWTQRYGGGERLARALGGPGGAFVWRPLATESRGAAIVSMVAAGLARGRPAIVLLPEVRFAGEAGDALRDAFGETVGWLGSNRPPRERYRNWLRLARGEALVAAGGRAAALAPVPNPGVIVVDDEAHPSYKERRAPRFHARAVAAERARRAGATLVLAGSPPSLEARVAAGRRPFSMVTPARADELRTRPPVTPIDLTREDASHVPSARLLAAARTELEAGRRVVLLVHRSGEEAARIAERARRSLPARRPARLDARSGAARVAAAARASDLIVATPVIAKDVEIPGVGLVGILEADAALSARDFRAAEEAFATWWHAGRWAGDGRVIIETAQPQHPAIRALLRWDPEILWQAESAKRSELGYPPFGTIVRLDVARDRSTAVAERVRGVLPDAEVLGPHAGEAADVILVRGRQRAALLEGLAPLAAEWRERSEPVRVDVDPREVLA